MRQRLFLLCLLVSCVVACTSTLEPPPLTEKRALVRIDPQEYPGFADDMDIASARAGALQSLKYLERLSPTHEFRFGEDTFSAAHIAGSIEKFLDLIDTVPTPAELREHIHEFFLVYRSAGRDKDRKGEVLFTGYFEPVMQGSLARTDEYRYPIYGRPDDWTRIDLGLFDSQLKGRHVTGRHTGHTVVPYYTREEIDTKGKLKKRGYELAWVKDPIGLFFLHIQGSGEIVLEDGNCLKVHYNCSNGRSYRSVGGLLIDENRICVEEMSMQRIRSYLMSNMAELDHVFNHNESYIFFEIVDEGPLGCLGVPLTPGRSIATDTGLFPKGALAFIQTRKPVIAPDGSIREWIDCNRFVFNQDTGAAIKGPGRVDLFCGKGSYADLFAGHMKQNGTLYFLVLKETSIF
jgi:membrane-bound lytic murein transglycosylase A